MIKSFCASSLCYQRTGEKIFSTVMNNRIQRWNIMLKSIGIGAELFHELIESNSYYVDKTPFIDRKSTRLNSSHEIPSRMPSSA